MASDYQLDNVDVEILNILIRDARTPFTEIAKELLVSAGTIHVRMKKLEELGMVTGSTLTLDLGRMGYDLIAFLGIYLQKGSRYNEVIEELKRIPQVIEAHYTTGEYSIFAKLVCKNTTHMRNVLNDEIQAIEGIASTETIISLEESIKRQIQVV